MKNLFKVLFVAGVATALVACNKEIENQTPETPGVRTVQFSTAPITKTVFGEASGTSLLTLWTENKTVGISLNFATAKQSTAPQVADGGTTATFKADIDDSGSAPYTFYAVSPYSSLISVNSDYKSANINIPSSQTLLANSTSVDESAQILVAKNNVGDSFPTSSVSMNFEHFTAYGKISFKNLTLADGETIASVSLTAPKNWVGRYYYYFEDNGTNEAGDIVENSASATITIITSSSTNIWFACAPVDLRGEDVNVVITTNQGTTYSKTITIPNDATGDKHLFKSGKVNAFTINMEGITADGAVDYVLVKNASELTVGSEVIIAAYGDIDYAISTTQNTNNWAATSATKSQDLSTISSPSVSVQRFIIAEGNQSGTIAFSFSKDAGTSYLCAQSTNSNHMKAETTLSDYSSWNVAIDSNTGEATVVSYSGSRNNMRYNPNNGNPMFSCYASTSTVDTKVAIYLYDPTTWNLTSIEVTNEPDKTAYEAGEDFDATGMEVTAHYVDAADNTHTKNVIIDNSSLIISPSTNLTAGTTSVSISFAGQSTTQAITVTAPITWDLQSIAVTTEPTKTIYTAGETFDPAGMVVTATYKNHDNTEQTKQEVVDNGYLTFSPTTSTPLTTSDESVSITYGGKSTTQAITVNAASATAYYVKVTSELNDWSGQYLFVFETNNVAFDGSLEDLDSTPNTFEVSISDSKIASSAAIDAKSFTIASVTGGYSIQAATGKYIGRSDNKNGMDISDDALVNTISWSNSQPLVAGSGGRKLGFNNDSNQKKFRYLGSPSAIQLYKLEDNTTWNLSSIAVTTAPTKTTYEAGEDFDATGMVVSAHYVDAADNTHTKDVIIDNSSLTISPSTNLTAGITSVTISYGGLSTTQSITVNAAKVWDLTSIAVKTAPNKTTYTEGEFFDPAGLVITPTYENRANTEETKTGADVAYSNDTAASFSFTPTTSTALETSYTSVSISYTEGGITKSTTQNITVNEEDETHYYVKVTSTDDISNGDYLIVYESGSVAFNGGLSSFDATSNTIDVNITTNAIEATSTVNAAKFTINSMTGGYSIMGASGKYITVNSYANGLATSTSEAANGIAFDSNGNVQITVSFSGGTMTLKYNSASNQNRFRYYKSGQQNIQLYKLN